jgi:acyl-coenzyme A synthetase/AMP-(fatty) acid ligase
VDAAHLKEELRKYLPNYFVPSQIRSVRELPKNANGKVDRNALLAELRQEAAK